VLRCHRFEEGTLALRLVTDTTADLPPGLRDELGVRVAHASAAFADQRIVDGEISPSAFYRRMRETGETPLPAGVPEQEFRRLFDEILAEGNEVACLVSPFDVIPTFTTASAAMLSLDEAGAAVKIVNPGVASAGLCALIASLGPRLQEDWGKAELMNALDDLEPRCDTLVVPADLSWLERAGRLALIEDRLGPIEDGVPVLRVGTRITGLKLEDDHHHALVRAVEIAGQRAGEGSPIIVTIDHADAPEVAERVAKMMQSRWNVARLIVTELSPTIGSQVGPGAVGIGVAPVAGGR
jgi:DegV family protein with EDD domain